MGWAAVRSSITTAWGLSAILVMACTPAVVHAGLAAGPDKSAMSLVAAPENSQTDLLRFSAAQPDFTGRSQTTDRIALPAEDPNGLNVDLARADVPDTAKSMEFTHRGEAANAIPLPPALQSGLTGLGAVGLGFLLRRMVKDLRRPLR